MKYRVTRPLLYSDPSCSGYGDPSARQGHYLEANNPGEAVTQMNAKYPADRGYFTIQEWEGPRWGVIVLDIR